MFSTWPFVRLSVCYQTCECDTLTTDSPVANSLTGHARHHNITVIPVEYAHVQNARYVTLLTIYSCCHAKHRSIGDWSAANSSAPSCVIAKNSTLMSSARRLCCNTNARVQVGNFLLHRIQTTLCVR